MLNICIWQILGPDSGCHPVSLTEVITSTTVKKAYRRATLYVHHDKLQQRGATIQQKYICEKVFDLLKVVENGNPIERKNWFTDIEPLFKHLSYENVPPYLKTSPIESLQAPFTQALLGLEQGITNIAYSIEARAFYQGQRFSTVELQKFYQGKKNTRTEEWLRLQFLRAEAAGSHQNSCRRAGPFLRQLL